MCMVSYRGRLVLNYIFFTLSVMFFSPIFALSNPWQGPYVGLYTGGGFGNNHMSTNVGASDSSYFPSTAASSAVNNAGTYAKHPMTVIAGFQAGHDWISRQLVYGIVMDYGSLALSSSRNVSNLTYPDSSDQYSLSTSASTNWLFTLRSRLGYATTLYWPSLLYVTGGLALTEVNVNTSFSDNSALAGAGSNAISSYEVGWTAGSGIELMSSDHASVDIEYLYVQIPSAETAGDISNTAGSFGIPIHSMTNPFSTANKLSASLLKIGFNYRFNE